MRPPPSLRLFALLTVIVGSVCGCASIYDPPERFLRRYSLAAPLPDSLELCGGFACRRTVEVPLASKDAEAVRALFLPEGTSPDRERRTIAQAVALFESVTGPAAGTPDDGPKNESAGYSGTQLDCIAESANTTAFLLWLQYGGLLRHHTVRYPANRHVGVLFYQHNTAVIQETATARLWAVDSWFHPGGAPPEIIPLPLWQDGYSPAIIRHASGSRAK